MPLMNSKTINAKTLNMEFKKNCQNMAYLFTDILNHWLAQRYKSGRL